MLTGKGSSFSTEGLEALRHILPDQRHTKHEWEWEEKEHARAQDGHSCIELPASPAGSLFTKYISATEGVYPDNLVNKNMCHS